MSRPSRFLKGGGGVVYGGVEYVGGRVSTLFRTWAWGHVGVVKSGKWEERLEIFSSKFVMIIQLYRQQI